MAKGKKKSTKKKSTKKKSSAKKEQLVVASKVKGYVKSKGMMTASDSIEGLNKKLYAVLDDAIDRTKANKRSTVKPQDL